VDKKKIGIVSGGYSGEAVISMKSAEMILSNINREKYDPFHIVIEREAWYVIIRNQKSPIRTNDFSFEHENERIRPDLCLIMIHGTPGEDGKLQGYFDMIGMPYTTGGVLNLSLTFNKRYTNDVLKARGFHTASGILLSSPKEFDQSEILSKLSLPVFVKPNEGGSSLGISKVMRADELEAAVSKAYNENSSILIEEFLDGREFTCGVICGENVSRPLAVTEIITERDFFDYQAKYDLDKTQEITPADLPEALYQKCMKVSVEIAESLDCRGIVRVDYKLIGEEFYVIEINTVPGMSLASLVPKQAESIGLNKSALIDLIIESTSQ
jgi:D-alanine-D-alanine ligase